MWLNNRFNGFTINLVMIMVNALQIISGKQTYDNPTTYTPQGKVTVNFYDTTDQKIQTTLTASNSSNISPFGTYSFSVCPYHHYTLFLSGIKEDAVSIQLMLNR